MSDSYERGIAYLLFALCLGLSSACAKSKGPNAGTNTNWLQACDTTADCKGEGEGECLCGVCTVSCTRQASCEPLAGTRCVALSERSCDEVSGSACLPVSAGMELALEAGPTPLQTGESASDCYAPDRDPALAQASDAVGCECARKGLEYCAGGVAMACTAGADGLRWRTVPSGDGACDLTVTNCVAIHSRADPSECLAEYRMCAELSDGRYCGVGCYSQATCPASGCEPRLGANGSVPPGAPSRTYQPHRCRAPELREYAKEGMCGDVHYRIVNYGTHGYESYWDAASGALVAYSESDDSGGGSCSGSLPQMVYGDLSVVVECERTLGRLTDLCPPPEPEGDSDAGLP